ncbi:hypothetical protein [Clostridium sp. 001]|uniref:hypothetical protein n=1 Tax=Clostridium sp. 001 TaxID=1970093 RepID=UPI001C2BECFF|nr:hypothetical protein [Clostridium sp. 001]QXE20053.1 hypothetical protein B5S50_15135 [Clostridium sp. 001]
MTTDNFEYDPFQYEDEEIVCQISRWDDTLRIRTEYKGVDVDAVCSYKRYRENMSIIEFAVKKELRIIDEKGKDYYEKMKLKKSMDDILKD